MSRCRPCHDSSCGWGPCSCDCHKEEQQPVFTEACAKQPAVAAYTIEKLHAKVLAMETQIRDYEHAMVNMAKLNGVCWAKDGRSLHDVYEVADRILLKHKAALWAKVKELPCSDLVVDPDTGEVSLMRKPHKRLALPKKGKKR